MEAEPAGNRSPVAFESVWKLPGADSEKTGEEIVRAFLLHGVVFLELDEDDKLLKDSERLQKYMNSFFSLSEAEKAAFGTGHPVGDTGYYLRAGKKEQYQIRYGAGAIFPKTLLSRLYQFVNFIALAP